MGLDSQAINRVKVGQRAQRFTKNSTLLLCNIKRFHSIAEKSHANISGFLLSAKEVMNNLQPLLHMHG